LTSRGRTLREVVRSSERLGLWLAALLVVVLGLLVAAVPALRDAFEHALHGDTAGLREELRDLGVWGVVVVEALIIVHAVVFFPAEIVNLAAGFVYGFWLAFPLVLAGWVASGLLSYWLGRTAARPLLHRLMGRRRFEAAEGWIERGGVPALIAARLIPFVPYSVASYVAGAARVPLGRFTWTTAVGIAPITAAVVLLGARLEEFSLTDPLIWLSALLLLALLGVTVLARRRF
jgi:uncharacterized membrane protein YdjX (TVP38/TMEM64 family)